jgi:hypothetical protein
MRKRGSRIYFTLFWLILIVTGCSEPGSSSVDTKYSEYLCALSGRYRAISGTEVSSTVGVLQIFSGADQDDVTDVAAIVRGELLLESRERKVIDQVISSIQLEEDGTDAACDLKRNASWILVAYDTTLERTGVIRLYECSREAAVLIGIRPVGDAAITYSRETGAVLRSLGVIHLGPKSS